MKKLNEHGVCTDPEKIVIYSKDAFHKIRIKIAQTPGGWANGYDIMDYCSGSFSPCTLSGAVSREDAVNKSLAAIKESWVVRENPHYQKAVRAYEATKMQLTLF